MADLQVTCITKFQRQNTHEAITHLGGPGSGAIPAWYSTRQQVIDLINGGVHTFYTRVNGVRANVEVRGYRPNQYLQTRADGDWNNNLLALPDCA
ncbi:DUF3892 domain-containing protein [uncultured Caulobacter sp.]|uniref:DUF3892 domain-containing protein n=1 Tax=uncultured Caulobacter sp. TaxID=158749 RepID=UPI002618B196|nr:DUF3892 domain-containing protein [uncultured Caulobacter sp.]